MAATRRSLLGTDFMVSAHRLDLRRWALGPQPLRPRARRRLRARRHLVTLPGHKRYHADRLTLLATLLRELEGRRLNLVSFTSGTSFNISDSGGHAGERVLLYWLPKKAWGSDAARIRGIASSRGPPV